jgi:signal transduction histidine kinase
VSREDLVEHERLATMGELAAQLAHEVRNPMLAIGANLESMSRGPIDGRIQERLGSLSAEIRRMDMILKKYLAARSDLSFREVRLADVVQDARQLLEGARKQAGKKITVSVDPGLGVWGDHDSLKHLVFNLLLNALEASPSGGEVSCRVEAGERALTLFVEDRGPGLAAPVEHCFRPFFTTKKNGTGLGLAVCQKLAKAHGGVVDLRAREGGGCQAVLVLPRRNRGGDGTKS